MTAKRIPEEPLHFIRSCVRERRIYWTYHVNMRLGERPLTRDMILEAVDEYEIIESNPEEKRLPSYLVFARHSDRVIHVLFAADTEGNNVRVVTAYIPDPRERMSDLKTRSRK